MMQSFIENFVLALTSPLMLTIYLFVGGVLLWANRKKIMDRFGPKSDSKGKRILLGNEKVKSLDRKLIDIFANYIEATQSASNQGAMLAKMTRVWQKIFSDLAIAIAYPELVYKEAFYAYEAFWSMSQFMVAEQRIYLGDEFEDFLKKGEILAQDVVQAIADTRERIPYKPSTELGPDPQQLQTPSQVGPVQPTAEELKLKAQKEFYQKMSQSQQPNPALTDSIQQLEQQQPDQSAQTIPEEQSLLTQIASIPQKPPSAQISDAPGSTTELQPATGPDTEPNQPIQPVQPPKQSIPSTPSTASSSVEPICIHCRRPIRRAKTDQIAHKKCETKAEREAQKGNKSKTSSKQAN